MKKTVQKSSSGTFFVVSKFRLISTLCLILMSILALTPWSFETQIGNTSVINLLLTLVMVVGFVLLIVDLIVTRDTEPSTEEIGNPGSNLHG